jgi:hypothetical protein
MRGLPDVMDYDRHEINKKYISGLSKIYYRHQTYRGFWKNEQSFKKKKIERKEIHCTFSLISRSTLAV